MQVAERLEVHGDVERLHVSRLFAGKPVYWVSVYHVDGVLVDSGASRARPAVARFVASRRPRHVLTTHEHEDHVGNHDLFGPDVTVHVTPRTRTFLAEGPPAIPAYRWFTWGVHGPARPGTLVGDRVDTGKRTYRVVPVPGHALDQVAYLDEGASSVFSGDAYLGPFRAMRAVEDLAAMLESIRRLADLDVSFLYPAHGPMLERPRVKLHAMADRYDGLAREAARLADRRRPLWRIAREVLGPTPPIVFASMGEFSDLELARQLIALGRQA